MRSLGKMDRNLENRIGNEMESGPSVGRFEHDF